MEEMYLAARSPHPFVSTASHRPDARFPDADQAPSNPAGFRCNTDGAQVSLPSNRRPSHSARASDAKAPLSRRCHKSPKLRWTFLDSPG